MREWQITLLGAIIMFMAGIGIFLWGNSLEFSAILLEAYPEFTTFLTGALFAGFGGGLLICTLLIYQLEKS